MKKGNTYLTIEEKIMLAKKGINAPIRVKHSARRNSFIAKLRGTIFDGSLNNKRIRI